MKKIILAVTLLSLAFTFTWAQEESSKLPRPRLVFTGTEDFKVDKYQLTRYKLSVENRRAYPDAMFAPAPDLPPCGSNTNASRSWVDIFARGGQRIYGFCALGSSETLGHLWFAVPKGEAPPDYVHIVIEDRKLKTKLVSNVVSTGAP